MISIIAVIDKLLNLLQVWAVRQQQKKAQNERNKLENDPYLWFDAHFNGVPESTRKTTDTDKASIKDTTK
jgi:hypothetical protein